MKLNSRNLKLIIGVIYLLILFTGLFFLFSLVDLKDLTSYGFIKSQKNIIFEYKNNNFLLFSIIFFIFCIVWVLFLGFASPLLIFGGFVFGQWWGFSLVLIGSTIGATLLYFLAGLFFKDVIEEKLIKKFSKFKEYFLKNDLLYFMCFRFVGGGGTPYAIQNVLPVIFNMPLKNYAAATFLGSFPSMFVTVAIGVGIEKIIDKNSELSMFKVLSSPEIYIPLICFFAILVLAYIIKRIFLKNAF